MIVFFCTSHGSKMQLLEPSHRTVTRKSQSRMAAAQCWENLGKFPDIEIGTLFLCIHTLHIQHESRNRQGSLKLYTVTFMKVDQENTKTVHSWENSVRITATPVLEIPGGVRSTPLASLDLDALTVGVAAYQCCGFYMLQLRFTL